MMRPLEGCQLQLSFADPANAFSALATSLQYQARALGMQIETAVRLDPEPEQADEILSISLSMPRQIGLALRPRTVCRIGFGADWANLAVSGAGGPLDPEHLAQASCGLMSVHGRASGKAQALGLPYVSTVCAALALQALMAAALAQLRGAGNRTCRVSMSGAALLCVGQYLAGATTQEAAERLLPGCNAIHERPPYVSCDGVWFELETLDAGPWRSFWLALGVDATSAAKGWQGFLLRYAKAIAPQPAVLMQTLAALPYAQIAAHAQQAGLAICPLRSLAQRASDADANALWQQGPWAFSGGAHLPAATLAALRAPGQDWHSDDLPLRGISVIESCRRIQGPLAGHLLALLGARVIRIEAPGGDPLRGMAPLADGISARFDALNRLKSVVEIDLKSTAGRAQVLQQAAGADVFLHNWAPGKAAQ
ncbi:MAG: hypothetical protein RL748_2439, partial [Pseudomonadota bacterium]